MYPFGEGVDLFIALEENARNTGALLERQVSEVVVARE